MALGKRDKAEAFDPDSSQYKACCGSCHIRTAVLIVCFVELIFCLLQLIGLVRNWTIFGSSYILWFLIGIFGVAMFLTVIALLFYAVKVESSFWVFPHLFAQVFLIAVLIAAIIVVFFLLVLGHLDGIRRLVGHESYRMTDESTVQLGIMIIVIYTIVAILEICFFFIVLQYFRYLKAKERAGSDRSRFVIKTATVEAGDEYEHRGWQAADSMPRSGFYQPPVNSYPGSPDAGDIYPYGHR